MCGWVMNRGQYEPFTDEPMYDSILPFGLKRRGLAAPSVPRVALTRALFHLDRASHLPADLARLRELRMVVEPRAKAVEEVAGKVAGKAGEVGEVLAARGEGGAAAEVQEGWFSGAGWETKGNLTEAAVSCVRWGRCCHGWVLTRVIGCAGGSAPGELLRERPGLGEAGVWAVDDARCG